MNVSELFKNINENSVTSPWWRKETTDGRTYFRNQETGAVTVAMDLQKEESRALPDSQEEPQWQNLGSESNTFKQFERRWQLLRSNQYKM